MTNPLRRCLTHIKRRCAQQRGRIMEREEIARYGQGPGARSIFAITYQDGTLKFRHVNRRN